MTSLLPGICCLEASPWRPEGSGWVKIANPRGCKFQELESVKKGKLGPVPGGAWALALRPHAGRREVLVPGPRGALSPSSRVWRVRQAPGRRLEVRSTGASVGRGWERSVQAPLPPILRGKRKRGHQPARPWTGPQPPPGPTPLPAPEKRLSPAPRPPLGPSRPLGGPALAACTSLAVHCAVLVTLGPRPQKRGQRSLDPSPLMPSPGVSLQLRGGVPPPRWHFTGSSVLTKLKSGCCRSESARPRQGHQVGLPPGETPSPRPEHPTPERTVSTTHPCGQGTPAGPHA